MHVQFIALINCLSCGAEISTTVNKIQIQLFVISSPTQLSCELKNGYNIIDWGAVIQIALHLMKKFIQKILNDSQTLISSASQPLEKRHLNQVEVLAINSYSHFNEQGGIDQQLYFSNFFFLGIFMLFLFLSLPCSSCFWVDPFPFSFRIQTSHYGSLFH